MFALNRMTLTTGEDWFNQQKGPVSKQQVQDYEIRLLREALALAQFNQRRAAKLLDLTYDQLRGYLRKYELLGKGE